MWQEDAIALGAFDDMMSSLNQPMSAWLTAMHPHSEQSMQWLTLFTLGRFVRVFNQMRENGEEVMVAYNAALAACVSDPQVQAAIAQMTGQMLDRRFE